MCLAVIVDVVLLIPLSAQFNGYSIFCYSKAFLFLVLFVRVEESKPLLIKTAVVSDFGKVVVRYK